MGRKLFRRKAEEVLKASGGEWLGGSEVMYRTNQKLPGYASCNVGAISHFMRVLKARGCIEIRKCGKYLEYRWIGE